MLARQSQAEDAIRLSEEAIQLTEVTDYLNLRANCHIGLAEVLNQSGRVGEAISAAEDALDLYGRKGNTVSAASARALIENWKNAPKLK